MAQMGRQTMHWAAMSALGSRKLGSHLGFKDITILPCQACSMTRHHAANVW
jgi:hypothetical protein